MKKTVPFKKELFFKENIAEITSISLEHSLHNNNNQITGEFIITGEYKVTQQSVNVDKFEFKVPFFITIDDKYDTKNVVVDIDDFYYEIKNSNVLSVSIEVLLDKLEEIEIRNQEIGEIEPMNLELFNDVEEEDEYKEIEEKNEKVIIKEENFITKNEDFVTYKIYIVKENDTIDSIMTKYKKTKEDLEKYNKIDIINIGDKIIIPTND